MSLEQSLGLNNEYAALYGEVVEYDIYHLRDVKDIVSCNDPTFVHVPGHSGINFIPETVIDLGGNVGVFSRYAQTLWPESKIIAVEPNPVNCEVFRANTRGVKLIEAAIGKGRVYRVSGSSNGAMEVYITQNLGYNDPSRFHSISEVKSIMLTDLEITGKSVLKMDIEGAETSIFEDGASMKILSGVDYICGELHNYSQDAETNVKVRELTEWAIEKLRETHNVTLEHIYLYARKR